ncbi:MAG: glycosyltransferase, partial [Burkholderiaceae bacterium]
MRLAIIVPVLNESSTVSGTLARLAPLRRRGAMVIVVDGGSADGTVECARGSADHVLVAPRSRASQMNAGARHALEGNAIDALLFLHADTRLPARADDLIDASCAARPLAWGRFDVRIEGRSLGLSLVAAMMNFRSRLTGICTG